MNSYLKILPSVDYLQLTNRIKEVQICPAQGDLLLKNSIYFPPATQCPFQLDNYVILENPASF